MMILKRLMPALVLLLLLLLPPRGHGVPAGELLRRAPSGGPGPTAWGGRVWEHQEAEDAGGAPMVPRMASIHTFFADPTYKHTT